MNRSGNFGRARPIRPIASLLFGNKELADYAGRLIDQPGGIGFAFKGHSPATVWPCGIVGNEIILTS